MITFSKQKIHSKKVTLLRTLTLFILSLATMLLISLISSTTSFAASVNQKVYDFYDLFTEDEVRELENIAKEYGAMGQVDIVMITEESLDGKSIKGYLEDFYDAYGFGFNKSYGDAVLILVNMDPSNRGVEIQGYGDAEYYIQNDRIEHILDDITPLLSDNDYYKAMVEFAKQVAYYMNETNGVNTSPVYGEEGTGNYYGEASYNGPSDYYGEEFIFFNPFIQIGISIAIGAITVGIMAYDSGGRVTVNNRTYLDNQHSNLIDRRDDYIRTVTTRVRKPSNNNGDGRSSRGGGISLDGYSHSGGGREF